MLTFRTVQGSWADLLNLMTAMMTLRALEMWEMASMLLLDLYFSFVLLLWCFWNYSFCLFFELCLILGLLCRSGAVVRATPRGFISRFEQRQGDSRRFFSGICIFLSLRRLCLCQATEFVPYLNIIHSRTFTPIDLLSHVMAILLLELTQHLLLRLAATRETLLHLIRRLRSLKYA